MRPLQVRDVFHRLAHLFDGLRLGEDLPLQIVGECRPQSGDGVELPGGEDDDAVGVPAGHVQRFAQLPEPLPVRGAIGHDVVRAGADDEAVPSSVDGWQLAVAHAAQRGAETSDRPPGDGPARGIGEQGAELGDEAVLLAAGPAGGGHGIAHGQEPQGRRAGGVRGSGGALGRFDGSEALAVRFLRQDDGAFGLPGLDEDACLTRQIQ